MKSRAEKFLYESTFKDYLLNVDEEKPKGCTENSHCEILHQQTIFRREMSQCTLNSEYDLLFIITIKFPHDAYFRLFLKNITRHITKKNIYT